MMLILKHGSTLIFSIIGVYGFSILQNPHTVEANKDANYLDLAKENCILTNEMQFVRVEGTVDMGVVGNHEVYYIVKDENNNEIRSEKVTVNVVDTIAPTIEYVGTIPMEDGKIKISYVQGGSYTKPDFVVSDNTVAGAKLVERVIQGPIDSNVAGKYILEYYAVDNYGNSSEHITVEVEVTEYIPAPKITGRKSATSGLKSVITDGKVYNYDLYVYTTQATKITIVFTDLDDETNTRTDVYTDTALDSLKLTRGKYTITAVGSSEKETRTVTFTVDPTTTK